MQVTGEGKREKRRVRVYVLDRKKKTRTKMKSLMYEDWYKIEIPAAAKGADSSWMRAPELSVTRVNIGIGGDN